MALTEGAQLVAKVRGTLLAQHVAAAQRRQLLMAHLSALTDPALCPPLLRVATEVWAPAFFFMTHNPHVTRMTGGFAAVPELHRPHGKNSPADWAHGALKTPLVAGWMALKSCPPV